MKISEQTIFKTLEEAVVFINFYETNMFHSNWEDVKYQIALRIVSGAINND